MGGKNYIKKILSKLNMRLGNATFPTGKSTKVGGNLIHGKYLKIDIQDEASLSIGHDVSFREFCNVLVMKGAELTIGNNVFFNNYCSINCLGKINIASNTIIGEGVKFYDHNHKYARNEEGLKVFENDFKIGKISVGKNCWIGSNVTILNNVEIGDNVIIGANCLIYKSVPSNSIVKHVENLIVETF